MYPLHSRLSHCRAFVGTVALCLSGCSIHPLPGDIARVSTTDIVERIRCEAQEGLRSFQQDDPVIRRIVANTDIGYTFFFKINEDNKAASGHLKFTTPNSSGGSFEVDMPTSASLARANTRGFILLEDFTKLNNANCSPEATRANW